MLIFKKVCQIDLYEATDALLSVVFANVYESKQTRTCHTTTERIHNGTFNATQSPWLIYVLLNARHSPEILRCFRRTDPESKTRRKQLTISYDTTRIQFGAKNSRFTLIVRVNLILIEEGKILFLFLVFFFLLFLIFVFFLFLVFFFLFLVSWQQEDAQRLERNEYRIAIHRSS